MDIVFIGCRAVGIRSGGHVAVVVIFECRVAGRQILVQFIDGIILAVGGDAVADRIIRERFRRAVRIGDRRQLSRQIIRVGLHAF